jgi:hypothetical protein
MVKVKEMHSRLDDLASVRWNLAYTLHMLGLDRPKWML